MEFNSYFTSIGIKVAAKFVNDSLDSQRLDVNDDDVNNDFNMKFVLSILLHLLQLTKYVPFLIKTSGFDNSNGTLFKLAAPILFDSLAYLCNLSLYISVFPSDWKCAKVTPVFKEGDQFDVSNCKPVSVL